MKVEIEIEIEIEMEVETKSKKFRGSDNIMRGRIRDVTDGEIMMHFFVK